MRCGWGGGVSDLGREDSHRFPEVIKIAKFSGHYKTSQSKSYLMMLNIVNKSLRIIRRRSKLHG